MKNLLTISAVFLSGIFANYGVAATYYCKAHTVIASDGTKAEQSLIDKYKYAVKLEDEGDERSFVSRCSYETAANKVTCDRYKVDKIQRNAIGHKIKKYYYFRGMLDFQIYPSLNSIENNGRGMIQFGKCEIIAP